MRRRGGRVDVLGRHLDRRIQAAQLVDHLHEVVGNVADRRPGPDVQQDGPRVHLVVRLILEFEHVAHPHVVHGLRCAVDVADAAGKEPCGEFALRRALRVAEHL